MSVRPDILVYSPDNKPVLVVEVKNKRAASQDWAAQMRHNLMSYPAIANSEYFMLALPDVFYLWKHALPEGPAVAPDYIIDPKPLLSPYVDQRLVSLEKISGRGIEMLVTIWLSNLAASDLSSETSNPALGWLFESGLYAAIKNGSILLGDAAA
jgi:hypothetical protein